MTTVNTLGLVIGFLVAFLIVLIGVVIVTICLASVVIKKKRAIRSLQLEVLTRSVCGSVVEGEALIIPHHLTLMPMTNDSHHVNMQSARKITSPVAVFLDNYIALE